MRVAVAFAGLIRAFVCVRVRGLLMPLRAVVRMILDTAISMMRE
jgi:hypothetical protein